MSSIDYSDKIPNNVNLSEDRTLQRALERREAGGAGHGLPPVAARG